MEPCDLVQNPNKAHISVLCAKYSHHAHELLIPWTRVLLMKPKVAQLIKPFTKPDDYHVHKSLPFDHVLRQMTLTTFTFYSLLHPSWHHL
jgi:hypothetical protein